MDIALSPKIQIHLLRDLYRRHPLPWTTDVDWTLEVYDARGHLVTKLATAEEYVELCAAVTKLAREDGRNREPEPCAPGEHRYGPEADDLSEELWEVVDPVCTVCGWHSSDLKARKLEQAAKR